MLAAELAAEELLVLSDSHSKSFGSGKTQAYPPQTDWAIRREGWRKALAGPE